MHVVEHEPLEQLREMTRRQKRAREHLRFRAVVLAREGRTAPQIAESLGCGRRPAQEWVRRYNLGGVAALAEGRHTGRRPRLSAEQGQKLGSRIDAGPTPADGTCAFHGEDVRKILDREFGVALKLSAVYDLLHRLGYSRLCPRPRHPDADPAAREAFKKRR
jgi:transposase